MEIMQNLGGKSFSKMPLRASNEGPPDLDDLFKDLRNKINNLFRTGPKRLNGGGNFNQNQGTSNNGSDRIPVLPIIIIVLLIWMATGFYIVDQGSRGIELRFGKYLQTTQPGPSWHLPYPIETVEVVDQEQVRTIEVGYRTAGGGTTQELRESLMLTGDENIIDLQFAIQYNLKSSEDYLFKNRSTDSAVRGAAESAMREIVGKSNMDFVLYEGREEIALRAKELVQSILDLYQTGINVTSITMQNAQPPEQVQAAFDDAVKAKQDLERQKNEGLAYANDIVPKATGSAARLMAEANAYKVSVENESKGKASRFSQILTEYLRAPVVTRNRLFLEAQEQILSSVSKVIVDQKGSNSLLYLPLDKMINNQTRSLNKDQSSQGSVNSSSSSASDIINSIKAERTRDTFRTRERDAR